MDLMKRFEPQRWLFFERFQLDSRNKEGWRDLHRARQTHGLQQQGFRDG
jgi:hypothetical protein